MSLSPILPPPSWLSFLFKPDLWHTQLILGFINRPANHHTRCPLQALTTRPSLWTPPADCPADCPADPLADLPADLSATPASGFVAEDITPPCASSTPHAHPSIEDSILHGSNYDQKLLLKFSSPAPSPPTPRLSSPPASPVVPYKSTSPFDELNELDFLPVASLSPPPTFTCRRPNLRSIPVLCLGIRHTTPFEPSECCRKLSPARSYFNLENATFIEAVRSAPFVPSSITHGYSETPGPLYVPYIDPPIDSSVSIFSPR
jgi:hypothetical protein